MTRRTSSRDRWAAAALILLVAVGFRVWLITSGAFSFDSDEAIVGLMARHINQGYTVPTFYYGQDYMGSLDALLVALGFRVLGESVQTMRVVQLGLYVLALISGYALALTVTRRRRVALVALLLLAIPTALGTLYTGITLGGYNEIVILGNLVLLFGWQVTVGGRRGAGRWIGLGLAAGLGWWTNGAIVTACLVAGLLVLGWFVWPGAASGTRKASGAANAPTTAGAANAPTMVGAANASTGKNTGADRWTGIVKNGRSRRSNLTPNPSPSHGEGLNRLLTPRRVERWSGGEVNTPESRDLDASRIPVRSRMGKGAGRGQRARGIPWRGLMLAAAAFVIGSAPWWLYNLRHDWAALTFLTGGFEPASGVEPISPVESLIGLLVLGLPALYGLRYPWQAGLAISAGLALAALVYLVLVTDLLAGWYARLRRIEPDRESPDRAARRWVWLVSGLFALVFTLSSFSDATGRYLMPVWTPAAIGVALGLDRLRRAGWAAAGAALAVLLVAQAGSVIDGAFHDTGLTPQLVERLRVPAADDAAVLDFLADEGYTRGYASYWTSFRLVFRSHEAVILATALPYDDKGFHAGNDRYPPYTRAVDAADRVVWITQNFPALDAVIAERLDARSITYRVRALGRYRVYTDFSERVAPADVGLDSPLPFDVID